jgi:transposase-like protein
LAGLRGEESLSVLCRRAGIAKSLYFSWSKEFLEAGKRRLSGDTARQASSSEVKELRSEALALKECGADLTLKTACSRKEDRSLSVMQRITCRVTAGGIGMRFSASEKLESLRTLEGSHLPSKKTLEMLGTPRTTFYRWYDRYLEGGFGPL